MASDLGRLSGPGQFVCCFSERIARRLVGETRGKKHFEFIYPELAEAKGIAPTPVAWLIIAPHDRDVIADDELGERTILPIRRVQVLVGGDVISCALGEECEAPRESSGKQNGVWHIARRHKGWRDGADVFMFPCKLFLQACDMSGRERYHDVRGPWPMDGMPGFSCLLVDSQDQWSAVFEVIPSLEFLGSRHGTPIADKVERGTAGRGFASFLSDPHG